MTDRERLINTINGILLASGCLRDDIKNSIYHAVDEYEITKRETGVVGSEDGNVNIIRRFTMAKAVAGRSPKTVKQYKLAVERFVRITGMNLVDVTTEDIRGYMAHRITVDGCKGYGLKNERCYLSTFFDWAVGEDLMRKNPVKQTETLKLAKMPKKAFSDMDCERLRCACNTLKERAVIETLFSTACRVSELVSILTSEIDGERVLICGKGKKYGTVYLDSKAQTAIESYIRDRKDNSPYLFPGRNGQMSTRAVEAMVKRIGARAGITNVHPHRFRRTAATMAFRRGMTIEMVSKMLRHENLQTTMKYLDISDDDLMYQHRKYVG